MSRLKAIFFDGYGTLVNVNRPFERVHEAIRIAGCDAPFDAVTDALKEEMAHYRDQCHTARDEATFDLLAESCARVFIHGLKERRVGISLSRNAVIAALMCGFHFELFPDVLPTVRALREQGLCLGVISNWDFRLPRILHTLGVGEQLHFVLTSAVERAPKPECAMFRKAIQLASVRPDEAWHVGDKVEMDCAPARACGIHPVLLDRERTEDRCSDETRIHSLLELVELTRASV